VCMIFLFASMLHAAAHIQPELLDAALDKWNVSRCYLNNEGITETFFIHLM
jgi:hypothetical protein